MGIIRGNVIVGGIVALGTELEAVVGEIIIRIHYKKKLFLIKGKIKK